MASNSYEKKPKDGRYDCQHMLVKFLKNWLSLEIDTSSIQYFEHRIR